MAAIFSPDSLEDSRLIAELVETDTQFGLDVYSLTADGEAPGEGTTFYRRKYRQTKSEIPDVQTLEDYWQHLGGAAMRNISIDDETYEIGGGDTPAFIFMRAEKAIEWLKENTGEDYTIYEEPEPATPVRLTTIEEDITRVLAVEFSDNTTKVVVLGDATRAIECAEPTDNEPVRIMFYPTPATTNSATRNIGTLSEDTISATITKASNDKAATLQIEGIDKTWLLWSLYDNSPCAVNPSCSEADTPKPMRLEVRDFDGVERLFALMTNGQLREVIEYNDAFIARTKDASSLYLKTSDIPVTNVSGIQQIEPSGLFPTINAEYEPAQHGLAATLTIEGARNPVYLWYINYPNYEFSVDKWFNNVDPNNPTHLSFIRWGTLNLLSVVSASGFNQAIKVINQFNVGIAVEVDEDLHVYLPYSPSPSEDNSKPSFWDMSGYNLPTLGYNFFTIQQMGSVAKISNEKSEFILYYVHQMSPRTLV